MFGSAQGSFGSILGMFLYGVLGASSVSKFIPLREDLALHMGASAAEFGWTISLVGLPAVLLALPSGLMVDRFGPRRVLNACIALSVLGNVILYFAPSLLIMQIARVFEGMASVHMYTAVPTFLMATTTGPRRITAMTLWSTYMPIGSAVGLWVASLLAGSDAWRNIFLLHAGLGVLVFLVNLSQPSMPSNLGAKVMALGERIKDLGQAVSRGVLLLLALAFFMVISLGFGANTTLPSYLARVLPADIAVVSGWIALATLLMVPGSLSVGALLTRGMKPAVLFTIITALGLLAGLTAFRQELDLNLRAAAVALWFLVSGAGVAATMALLPQVAEPQRRSAAAALLNQAGALATLVNPPLWLPLAAAGGWHDFAHLMLAAWVVALASVWWMARSSIAR
jgi:predicted MFS family arabinose efflux permease